MKTIHLPALGPRYWTALCIASIFGANMGDFFAHNLGLGHVAGLPFLALALVLVLAAERFDGMRHQVYYWCAIIIVRTAATNFADFAAGDLKLPRLWVMVALAILLAGAIGLSWQFVWRQRADKSDEVLCADLGYWICMFLAGTLGTEIGDYCSHNLKLDDGGAAVLLCPVVAVLFIAGREGWLLLLPVYWTTVVAIRAAGTAVGDYLSARGMLGLPLSTLATGVLFVVLLIVWKEQPRTENAVATT
ncbi:hypothetical protein IC762_05730 [Bradyrhizobium genosp. L]|uniref:hypothetical protein n=1 Tax=Bradyrhizobium genosp. L TaxID=83637 RepID=UPI0018A293BD|nr:hypothetical protein [Bradyrhizobium genosp. L]QPF85807.1 hypothetical protein IC762_05730 [Bradyrhizobium genosp. L]